AGAATTIAATLATAPLMSFHFGRVSLVSLGANLVALPVIAPIMWIGMLSAAVAQAWTLPAELPNALDAYLLGFVSSVAHLSSRLPGAVWEPQTRSTPGLACGYALVGAAAAAIAHRRRIALAAAIAGVVLAGAVIAAGQRRVPAPPSTFTATFLDVGQGDAT